MEENSRHNLTRVAVSLAIWVAGCLAGAEARAEATPGGQPQQALQAERQPRSGYSLVLESSVTSSSAPITVAWSAPVAHSGGDAIGLFKVGEPDTVYLSKKYVPPGASGVLTLSAPAQPGDYELRYLPSMGTQSVATSSLLTVSAAAGNIFLFSNYDGGTYTLVVDQNLPNIQIGILSYAPSHVTVTGPYARNVSVVRVAGYSVAQSTVRGIDPRKVQWASSSEPVTYRQPYAGNRSLGCATGVRVLSWPGGGCNSTTQVEEYFMSKFGQATTLSHMSRYGTFSGSIALSVARRNLVVVREVTHLNIAAAVGQPTGPVTITVEVNATVGATSTRFPALTTGSLASGSTVQLNNYATIVGAGGAGGSGGNGGGGGWPRTCSRDGLAGGAAIHLTVPTTISNRGNIWGGGGGGGGGSGCNLNAGGGGGAGYMGGAGGAGATSLSQANELAFCGQDNGVRGGIAGRAGSTAGGEGGKAGDWWGDGSYDVIGGDGGGYGQPGQPSSACVFASSGGTAGAAIKRNGYTVNIPDGAYDTGAGRIRGPVLP